MTLTKVKYSQIVDEDTVCVYCGTPGGDQGCCGEVHFEIGYTLGNGELLLDSEIIIIDDRPFQTKLSDYFSGIKRRLYWLFKTSPVNPTRLEIVTYRAKRIIPAITKQRWNL